MSGIAADNPYRVSGVIAAAAAGGLSWQDIVTASTLTAEAGNAYWIDTTSNAGVVATDVTGVGTARNYMTACSYN